MTKASNWKLAEDYVKGFVERQEYGNGREPSPLEVESAIQQIADVLDALEEGYDDDD
jgi:hypothetical protein